MTAICSTFKELAALTWRRIGQANRAGLFWSEETNTETLLLTMQERHPGQIAISAIPKWREARIGADWEWWFGEPGAWIGMRVQAKRIKLPQERFDGLFSQRAKSQPATQIDTLIDRADRDGIIPAYCFYVHSSRWPSLGFWPQRHMAEDEPTPLGCLIGHASSVRAMRSTTLSKIASISFPWHLLVCPADPTLPMAVNLAKVFRASFRALPTPTAVAAKLGHVDWPMMEPVQSLPDHVRPLLNRLQGEEAVGGDSYVNEFIRGRQLRGVALFTDTRGTRA